MLDSMKRNMALDFADSETVFTNEMWNDRYFRAEAKVNWANPRMLREDNEVREQLRIYLKGQFVSPTLHKNPSKHKLIRMVHKASPEMSIASLKRMSKSELESIKL